MLIFNYIPELYLLLYIITGLIYSIYHSKRYGINITIYNIIILLTLVVIYYIVTKLSLYNNNILDYISCLILLITLITLYVINLNKVDETFYYLFASFCSICLLYCTNFITLYIFIEGLSFTLYLLVSIKGESKGDESTKGLRIESSINYYILGSIFSCILLLGIFFIYKATGETNLFNSYLLSLLPIEFFNLEVSDTYINDLKIADDCLNLLNILTPYEDLEPFTRTQSPISAIHFFPVDNHGPLHPDVVNWTNFILSYNFNIFFNFHDTWFNSSLPPYESEYYLPPYISELYVYLSNLLNVEVKDAKYVVSLFVYYYYFTKILSKISILLWLWVYYTPWFNDILLYIYMKLWDFSCIQPYLHTYILYYILGYLLVLISIFFKLGLSPFSLWVPTIYHGASSKVSIFLSIIPKLCYVYILYILLYNLPYFNTLLTIVIIMSIFVGSISILNTTNFKSLIAYSSISSLGIILLPLLVNNNFNLFNIMFYLFIYIMNLLFLWIYIILTNSFNITSLKSIINNNTTLLYSFLILFLSFGSIPPLLGFFPKLMIFLLTLSYDFYLLTLYTILFSIISSFYYLRLISMLFFIKLRLRKRLFDVLNVSHLHYNISLLLGFIVYCSLFLGLFFL